MNFCFSHFYDLDFEFIVYSPAPESEFYSSITLHQSPATLIMLKHECFLRVEIHIFTDFDNEIIISFPNGSVINLIGDTHYVFTIILPGKFPLLGYVSTQYINGHYISMNEPVKVFLEEARFIHRYECESNAFVLATITAVYRFAEIKVKVWGVMLWPSRI